VYSQLYVEGSYTWSKDFGYQKDDTYKQFSVVTQKFEKIPTYLGQDYIFKQFKIGIGYRFSKSKWKHSIGLNYNRKGAGGDFAVDIYLDEFSKELLGDILIGHIQFTGSGGYTEDSTNYMFGVRHENIGLKYGISLPLKFDIIINPFTQLDYSYESKHRIISINNKPKPVTTGGNIRDSGIELNSNKYLISIGCEVEYSINKFISIAGSASQSINSYTKKGEIFTNKTFITAFELGLRFYQ
jgi:hypothetical protein